MTSQWRNHKPPPLPRAPPARVCINQDTTSNSVDWLNLPDGVHGSLRCEDKWHKAPEVIPGPKIWPCGLFWKKKVARWFRWNFQQVWFIPFIFNKKSICWYRSCQDNVFPRLSPWSTSGLLRSNLSTLDGAATLACLVGSMPVETQTNLYLVQWGSARAN